LWRIRQNPLIPQPLLPKGEKGSKIQVPLPGGERDLGFDVSAQPNGEGCKSEMLPLGEALESCTSTKE